MDHKVSRRELMKRAAIAAAAGFTIVPRHVLGGPGYVPPSEQLNKAVIGLGGMGRHHIPLAGTRVLALCDVDSHHLKSALELARHQGHTDVRGFHDWREVLTLPDVDIVHIATPPHWHGLMYIAAAQAGKDIWGEKPMTRTIAEGQRVVDTIEKHGRIFRINTRFRFEQTIPDTGIPCRPLKRLVDAGLLGWPIKATLSVNNGFPWKLDMWAGRTDLKPQTVPANLDYDMWLGPAPWRPYHPHRVHQSYRGYWDYDGGGLGDQGQHFLDPVQYLMGKDDTSPVEIEAEGPVQHPDAAGPWKRVRMRYADGCEIILLGEDQDKDPPVFEGPKAKVYTNFRTTIPDVEKVLASLPDLEPVQSDFTQAVRTRQKYILNESNSHRACTLVNLAKIAVRTLRPLRFDPVAQRFINDEAANRLLDEPMRAPWHV